ncbi:rhomboid family intramembrane serine protease, partial [Bacteroidales bacterium OttesenSCG-928-I21]|nr:rhomboid family intramembrane serine protease [Bacteroidales bacterium OttesenSCG-928-I21]
MNYVKSNFWSSIPVVVKNLLVINFLLWLATELTPRVGVDLRDILGLHYFGAEKFRLYQLITYMFMHGDFSHVFFNMFSLFIFGRTLEEYWGPKKFLIFYMVAGVGAGLVQELAWYGQYYELMAALNEAVATNSPEVLLPFETTLRRFFSFGNLADFNHALLFD